MIDLSFFSNKRVFITGHTGFKGTWLCHILKNAGAVVTGYALAPLTEPNLFYLSGIKQHINSHIGDIRNYTLLQQVIDDANPEIVFHLAAQPLVREGYMHPRFTYETNVMGTVNLLECVRSCPNVFSFVNITTDKVYQNDEQAKAFSENDPLCGTDPYSNSKSCSELVTHSYYKSFFTNSVTGISTARSGNVIGGGDFSANRIIPDCVRFATDEQTIPVRNPKSVRPYQHVLEPLFAYLLIAQKQYGDASLSDRYNIGPDEADCITTAQVADIFCKSWGNLQKWVSAEDADAPYESCILKLNSTKIREKLGWCPKWNIEYAIEKTVEWTKQWQQGISAEQTIDEQIKEYREA